MAPSLLLLTALTAQAEPWYARSTCDAGLQLVLGADFGAGEVKIKQLEASGDPADRACGAWLRVNWAEAQLAIGGKTPELMGQREKALARLYGFAKTHAKYGPAYADLEVEARTRRIRALVDAGERTDALKETKRVKELLEERAKQSGPTLDYVRGIVNLAVSQSPWPLRTLMGMAGIEGDAELGRKSLRALYEGRTVYRFDARYVMRFFAEESPEGGNGKALEYSRVLSQAFPSNPQFLYDLAVDQRREGDCAGVLATTAPAITQLQERPDKWSNIVRAKLFWISARCAKDTGKPGEAKKWVALAAAQSFADLEDEIDKLRGEL